MSVSRTVGATTSRVLTTALSALFMVSATQKILTYQEGITAFMGMELLTGSAGEVAYCAAIILELTIAGLLLLKSTMPIGSWIAVTFLVLVTTVYLIEWHISGSIPKCACGLESLSLPSTGLWLVIRNSALILCILTAGLFLKPRELNTSWFWQIYESRRIILSTTSFVLLISILTILHSLVFISKRNNASTIESLSKTLSSIQSQVESSK